MLKIKCLSLDLKNNSELAIPYEYLLHRSKFFAIDHEDKNYLIRGQKVKNAK